jgi:hypothetical protein
MNSEGKARPRKGQRVSFVRSDGQALTGRRDIVTGLRFTVHTAHGGTVLIDLVTLRPRRLALAFGSALRELAPTMVRTTVVQHLNGLKRFFRYLADTAATISGPEHLRQEHIDGFESWLEAQCVTAIHRHTIIAKVIIALRTIDASRPGVLDDKLRQRLRYTSARPAGRSTPRDAYSGFVAKQLRDAARVDIQAVTRRLAPTPIEHSDATLRDHLETAAAVIETDGTIGHRHPALQSFYRRFHLLGLEGGAPIRDLHARRYLLAEDVVAFFVALSLETGLEPECVKALRVDCLRNPASGTVEIAYVKRRARGSEWKHLRVRDGASSTPGGIIRILIELTAAARRQKPSDSLWVYFHTGRLEDRIVLHGRDTIDNWVARHGIVDDAGQPLHLLLSRLRKTHKALWYAKTQGDMARFAIGHTPEVAARHYADLPSLRHLHEQAVADGLNDALASALQPRIVTPEEEAIARRAPSKLQLSVPAAEARRVLSGKNDVWLASCSGFHNSPFAPAGEPCSEPFWGCLECQNAVITARKLPAIIAFLDFIVTRRAEMTEADWWAKFGQPWSRITQQILPAFSDAVVTQAREKAKAIEHRPYLPLEAHT